MDHGESEILEEDKDEDYEPTEEELHDYAECLGMKLPEDEPLLWIARDGLKASLPPGWKPCRTKDDEIYYFNFNTRQSQWDHPCDEYFRTMYQNEKRKLSQGGSRPQPSAVTNLKKEGSGSKESLLSPAKSKESLASKSRENVLVGSKDGKLDAKDAKEGLRKGPGGAVLTKAGSLGALGPIKSSPSTAAGSPLKSSLVGNPMPIQRRNSFGGISETSERSVSRKIGADSDEELSESEEEMSDKPVGRAPQASKSGTGGVGGAAAKGVGAAASLSKSVDGGASAQTERALQEKDRLERKKMEDELKAKRDKWREDAERADAADREALRKEHENKRAQLRKQLESETAVEEAKLRQDKESKLKRARDDAEKSLKAEEERIAAETKAKLERARRTATEDYEKQLAEMKKRLEAEHAAQVADVRAKSSQQALGDVEAANAAALEKMLSEHAKKVEELKAQLQKELDAVTTEGSAKRRALESENERSLARMREEHARVVEREKESAAQQAAPKDVDELEARAKALRAEVDALVARKASLAAEIEEASKRQTAPAGSTDAIRASTSSLITSLEAERDSLSRQLKDALASASAAKAEAESMRQERAFLERDLAQLRRQLAQYQQELESRPRAGEDARAAESALRATIERELRAAFDAERRDIVARMTDDIDRERRLRIQEAAELRAALSRSGVHAAAGGASMGETGRGRSATTDANATAVGNKLSVEDLAEGGNADDRSGAGRSSDEWVKVEDGSPDSSAGDDKRGKKKEKKDGHREKPRERTSKRKGKKDRRHKRARREAFGSSQSSGSSDSDASESGTDASSVDARRRRRWLRERLGDIGRTREKLHRERARMAAQQAAMPSGAYGLAAGLFFDESESSDTDAPVAVRPAPYRPLFPAGAVAGAGAPPYAPARDLYGPPMQPSGVQPPTVPSSASLAASHAAATASRAYAMSSMMLPGSRLDSDPLAARPRIATSTYVPGDYRRRLLGVSLENDPRGAWSPRDIDWARGVGVSRAGVGTRPYVAGVSSIGSQGYGGGVRPFVAMPSYMQPRPTES